MSHVFTTNPAERDHLVQQGYRDETAAADPLYVFDRSVLHAGIRTIPLRRLAHPSGDHFYPADPDEAFIAVNQLGYVDETRLDSIWVLPGNTATPPGSTRLYQFRNAAGDHYVTTDPDEVKPGYQRQAPRQEVQVLKLPEMAEGITAVRLFRLYQA